jgi:hypothetical protein
MTTTFSFNIPAHGWLSLVGTRHRVASRFPRLFTETKSAFLTLPQITWFGCRERGDLAFAFAPLALVQSWAHG